MASQPGPLPPQLTLPQKQPAFFLDNLDGILEASIGFSRSFVAINSNLFMWLAMGLYGSSFFKGVEKLGYSQKQCLLKHRVIVTGFAFFYTPEN